MKKFVIQALVTIILAFFIQQCPAQSCQDSSPNSNLPIQIKICYKELYKKASFLISNTLFAHKRLTSTYNINGYAPCFANLNIKKALLKGMNLTNKNLTTSQSLRLNKDLLNELTNTLRSNSAKVSGTLPLIKRVLKDSMAMTNLLDVVLNKVQRLQHQSGRTTATTTASGIRTPIKSAAQLMTPNQIVRDMICRVERLNAFALEMQIKFFNMSRPSF